jgi:hypothetical protein
VDSQRAKLESREQRMKMEKVVSLKQALQARGLRAESSLNSILKFRKLYVKIRLSGFLQKKKKISQIWPHWIPMMVLRWIPHGVVPF